MNALVIDDSRATRAILSRILRELDYEVTEAGDGSAGLAALDRLGGADLVLVDWNMPVLDGLGFVRNVRADRRYDDTVLIMVTTEADISHMVTALDAGVSDYAMKPFTAEVIREKLQLLGVGA